MENKEINQIIKNTLTLQGVIAKQVQQNQATNVELTEIVDEIPNQINVSIDALSQKLSEEQSHCINSNLKSALSQIDKYVEKLEKSSKILYYKPFIIHTVFFIVMTFLMGFILNFYLNSIKEERILNTEKLKQIEQIEKKAQFSVCGNEKYDCVKIIQGRYYGKNAEYALLDTLKGKN